MKNLIFFGLILLLVGCVPHAEDLELRPDDIEAPVVRFGAITGTAQGPATVIKVNFIPVNDGLSQEQINGLQAYVMYVNGSTKGSCAPNETQIMTTLINNRTYILGMGIRYELNGETITTLPGTATETLKL